MKPDIFTYTAQSGKTRYLIATYDEHTGQYTAAMDAESERLTGCYAVFARTVAGLVGNTTTYAHRTSARRALRRQDTTNGTD